MTTRITDFILSALESQIQRWIGVRLLLSVLLLVLLERIRLNLQVAVLCAIVRILEHL